MRQHGLLLKILFALALVACGTAAETLAANADGDQADSYSVKDAETYIMKSEAAWDEAAVAGDPSVAQHILADDYVGVFPDGKIVNKAEALAVFKPGEVVSAHLDYAHIRFFGNTAVAQGRDTLTMRSGDPKSGRFIFTDVWVRRNGQWQIVNSEDQYQPPPK